MTNTVKKWIYKNNMIGSLDTIVCAVSGGVDSIVMLHMLSALSQSMNFSVVAAHFNHCIRGKESDRDQDFVEDFCTKHGIPFYVGQGDVLGRAAANKESVEEAARILRYEFLESVAKEVNGKIATAHHADDNLETIFINMIHGTSTKGLAGIPPVRGNIIRPLLCLTRDQINEYAQKHGLDHVEDSTNKSDDYLRNRIRHNIIPLLKQENPNVALNMVNTSSMLREETAVIDSQTESAMQGIRCGDHKYSSRQLIRLPNYLLRRVVYNIIMEEGIEPSSKNVYDLIECIKSDKKEYHVALPNNVEAIKFDDFITFEKNKSDEKLGSYAINTNGETVIEGTSYVVTCKIVEKLDRISKNPSVFHVKYDSVNGNLSLRGLCEGDKIKMPYGTKRLSKVLGEAGWTKQGRHSCPIIVDENGVVAVYSIGIDMKHSVNIGDKCYEISVVCTPTK